MNPHALEQSAKALLASVIADGQWLPAMEDLAARMNVLGGGIARIAVPAMFAIPTSGVREQFLDFRSGKAPTLTRATPLNPTMEDGFVAEHLRLDEEILKRDVFYQEFLRPRGCSHHISALLDDGPTGTVNLLAFRPEEDGEFRAEELAAYDRILPYLRTATMVARGMLNAEARRQAEPFERRGEPVLYIGHDGRVAEMNAAAERANARLFEIVDRRVATVVPADQHRLDAILTSALSAGKPGLVTLTNFSGSGQVMALAVPIHGQALDVFRAISALVVFLEAGQGVTPDERSLAMLRDAVGLTARESEVVGLVVGGSTPREAAERLGIGLGTARLHLKGAFAKCGVHSQAELAALVRRLG